MKNPDFKELMTHKSHSGIYFEKQKPVENQLFKNDWDVKMIWPKLKDSKGKELTLTNKKTLLTNIKP